MRNGIELSAEGVNRAHDASATDKTPQAWMLVRLAAPAEPMTRKRGGVKNVARHGAILRAVQAEPQRTLQSFGDQFGITHERIRQIIKANGLSPKPYAPSIRAAARRVKEQAAREQRAQDRLAADIEKWAPAVALRKQGLGYLNIGQRLGVGAMTVWHWCQKARAQGLLP